MKHTPLYETHRAAGAKLADFAGWEMPIQYSGVVDEYHTVRTQAGLFDVSHMGRIAVTGPGSLQFLQRLTTNDVSRLPVGHSHYSMVCNEQGGIKDDVFVYAVAPEEFLVCVNASNREKIVTWMQAHLLSSDDCRITDRSDELAQLALQGPSSRSILSALNVAGLAELKPRQLLATTVVEDAGLITRTGYTGELGYELYYPARSAPKLWDSLMEIGRPKGLKPAGLGARDLLRLEMAYLLYGNDIDEATTPMEASAEWVVQLKKDHFIGQAALVSQQAAGPLRRLVPFELLEQAVPRHGCIILGTEGKDRPIGTVTSGNFSPLLKKGIGLGYVPPALSAPGTKLSIDIRGKIIPAAVVKAPFYRKPRAEG
ncbi:MAG TPA: glycine cleavage system aminomethyltransferase GcvT [Nitrospiraceae bacterium]|nr:glycine cleavage system aminomethyltransferase GcvT [Nitrospiraceae bacterium]